jgi:hypothetical protein
MQNVIALLGSVFLLSHAFDSVLRWALELFHMGSLIYLRDVAMVVAIVLAYVDIIVRRTDALAPAVLLASMAFGITTGIASGLSAPQVLFGAKVWLPLVLGFMAVHTNAALLLDRRGFWTATWALLLMGLFVNYFVSFPWSGMVMNVGDVSIVANREWSTSGFTRLSGFSRTSFDAAIAVILLACYLVVYLPSVLGRGVVWLLSGVAIILTTSKGVVGSYLAASVALPVAMSIRSGASAQAPVRRAAIAMTMGAVALLGLVAPIMAAQVELPHLTQGTWEHFFFSSLAERVWGTWPEAWELLSSWQYLLGRGLGGVGAAQAYFEPSRYSSVDNLFLYSFITAGMLGAAAYIVLAMSACRLAFAERGGQFCLGVMLFIFIYGLIANVVESALALAALGGAASYMLQFKREKSAHHVRQTLRTRFGLQRSFISTDRWPRRI